MAWRKPCAISKTIPCMLLLIIWKGYGPGHGWPPRATYEWFFRCYNVLASMGLKSFCPWFLKLEGTPKQSPSISERCILGWQLCVTYASHFPAWMHRASWTTVLGVKPSMTWNVRNMRDRKKQRSHTRMSQSPRDERRHPNYPAWRSPKDHRSGMPLGTCLVQPENVIWFTSWIFLDHPCFVSQASPHWVRQTVISFFIHNVYDVMVLTFTILS